MKSHFSYLTMLCLSSGILLTGCDSGDSHQAGNLYSKTLPDPLTRVEQSERLLAAGSCTDGGVRIVHGLDHNGDGRLGPFERLGAEFFCNQDALPGETGKDVAANKPTAGQNGS